MQIKLKLFIFIISIFVANVAMCNEVLDKKMQALPELESSFMPQSETISTSVVNGKNWSQSGLALKVNNHWQLTIASKHNVTIKKISIEMDGIVVANDVALLIKPQYQAHFLFASDNFAQQIQQLTKGYKILGIVQQLTSDDYIGYKNYCYKIVKFTINWLDNNSYNETTINFMMVYAK